MNAYLDSIKQRDDTPFRLTETGGRYTITADCGDTARQSYLGSGWVAEITGLHPQYTYARKFVARAQNVFAVEDNKIYEARAIYTGESAYSYRKRRGWSGFFAIWKGKIVSLTAIDIQRILDAPAAPASPKDETA